MSAKLTKGSWQSRNSAHLDQNGKTVVEYSYDPWGNIEYNFNNSLVTTEEEALLYTALCPLTYRGYNYDFTTGLYYLQSRYYNPEWGRFLNCDDTNILLATQGETHNANLFAYCDNNPVNRVDYDGRLTIKISLAELVIYLKVLIFGIKILEKSDNQNIYTQELCAFLYDIDEYGLIFFKYVFYDTNSKKYSTVKFVGGLGSSWNDLMVLENEKIIDFGDDVKLQFDSQSKTTTDMLFGQNATHRQNAQKAMAILAIADGVVYGVGRLVLWATSKTSSYKNLSKNGKNFENSLIVGFIKVKKYLLFSTAYTGIISNIKPRKYDSMVVI